MKYPYDRYMKVLLLKGHSIGVVSDRLKALKLTPPDDIYLDKLRDSFISVLPENSLVYIRPGVKYNFETFLKKAGDDIHKLDVDDVLPVLRGKRVIPWEEALLLMTDYDMRIMTTCMTVYGYTDDDIRKELKERYCADISSEGLLMFYRYFWDISSMSKLELYHYIASCALRKHRNLLIDCFHKKEKELKWRLTGENTLTLEEILTHVMNEAFAKFKESVNSEDVDNVNKTQQWANMAIRSAEKLRDVTSSTAPSVAADLELRLKKITQDDISVMDEDPDMNIA